MRPYNAVDIFDNTGQKAVQKKLFAQLDRAYTYGELNDAVKKITYFFQTKGLNLGDRIIISTDNKFAIGALVWACLRNGIAAIFLDPAMGKTRSNELIKICDASLLVIDKPTIERWGINKKETPVLTISQQKKKKGSILNKLLKKSPDSQQTSSDLNFWEIINKGQVAEFSIKEIPPETIAYVLFTSGSTSTPKAVQISHHALWRNLETIKGVYGLDEQSRIFNILTVYHTDGIIQGPVMTAMLQASWFSPMNFEVSNITNIFDAFYKYRISHFITVPTMLKLLYQFSEGFENSFLEDDFKYIVTSAAPFEIDFWRAFEGKFKVEVINNYGLTETVAGASYCGPESENRKVGSIGKPKDCEFKVVDENLNDLADDQTGELWIKGNNVLSSYLNNPEATEKAFEGDWFRTGDLVTRDSDGFYFLVGRKKNIIISGGINIQPEEVMSILNRHPAIQESACTGFPDTIFGEIPVAGVMFKQGQSANEIELTTFCRQELEEGKIPKQFFFIKELPKTSSGKIKFSALNSLLTAAQKNANQSANPDESSLQEAIVVAAAKAFQCSPESIDFQTANTLTVSGWDSLAHLTFITQLEEVYKIRFSSKEIMNISSLVVVEKTLKTKLTS